MIAPIGVLGGIFDPVHFGHLATARLACDYFQLNRFFYVPAGVPPHKQTTVAASPVHRLAMLQLALEGESGASIWDGEISSSRVSYTVDTLGSLRERFPETPIYFIVGADNLHEIPAWHRYRTILDMVTLCVAERPGFTMTLPDTLASARIERFPSPQWGLSSTQLRRYLSAGYSCRHLLPDKVREYIIGNGLYRTRDRETGTAPCSRAAV